MAFQATGVYAERQKSYGDEYGYRCKYAKQVVQDELESQINTVKAQLEVLANRAAGTMVKAEVEAYETLMPKLHAMQQKLRELRTSTVLNGSKRRPISQY